jgi:phosphate transport system substrate-binding protein
MHPMLAKVAVFLVATVSISLGAPGVAAAEVNVRMAGGTTWAKVLKKTFVSKLESDCGTSIDVQGIGSGRGLKKLMDRQAEIAMLAGSLDLIMKETNEKDPGTLKESDIRYTPIYRHDIAIAVNAGNPVGRVTTDQAQQIFSGKIRNWKQVGGPDMPIEVILPSKGEGSRLEVEKQLLDGGAFSTQAREMHVATEVPKALAESKGGIGSMPITHLTDQIKRLDVGRDIALPLGLVVRQGETSKPALCVVQTIAKLSAQ